MSSVSETQGLGQKDLLRKEQFHAEDEVQNASKPSYAKAHKIYGCLAVIAVAMLVFGILGMTNTSVFGDMGSTAAKTLTAAGGGMLGTVTLLYLVAAALRYQRQHQNPLAGSGKQQSMDGHDT